MNVPALPHRRGLAAALVAGPLLLLAIASTPHAAASPLPAQAARGRALATVGVGVEAVEVGFAVATLAQATRGANTGLAGVEIPLSLIGLGFTGPKIAGFREATGGDPAARRRGLARGWLQTGAHQLLLGALYVATAHTLDDRPWSTDVILSTIYALMALPHLILGAVALPVGLGLHARERMADRGVGARGGSERRRRPGPVGAVPGIAWVPGGVRIAITGRW